MKAEAMFKGPNPGRGALVASVVGIGLLARFRAQWHARIVQGYCNRPGEAEVGRQ